MAFEDGSVVPVGVLCCVLFGCVQVGPAAWGCCCSLRRPIGQSGGSGIRRYTANVLVVVLLACCISRAGSFAGACAGAGGAPCPVVGRQRRTFLHLPVHRCKQAAACCVATTCVAQATRCRLVCTGDCAGDFLCVRVAAVDRKRWCPIVAHFWCGGLAARRQGLFIVHAVCTRGCM